MLAMYVVLENTLGMVCDYPAAYEGQPGFEFIREVPTTWDETKVIDAKAGEFIVIARRKNNDWYIGAITNHDTREIKFPLDFLVQGKISAEIYSDAPDVANEPNHLVKEIRSVSKSDSITLKLSSGGGAVIRFKKE